MSKLSRRLALLMAALTAGGVVAVALGAAQFDPLPTELAVGLLDDVGRHQRTRETGPTGTALELVPRTEQRFPADDIDVEACALVVPELIVKRRLGVLFLRHAVLQRCQPCTQFLVGRLEANLTIRERESARHWLWWCCSDESLQSHR